MIIFTALYGKWPEIYGFATNPESPIFSRAFSAPVHLADDVMISLRSGIILNEIGIPAFNRTDRAQPSTSYVSPYLFSALLKIFPANLAVVVYALLGLFAVGLTAGFIFASSKSKLNGALIVAALFLTQTNLLYSLDGWDHLFQGLFLVLATVIALHSPYSKTLLAISSLALVLGSLFRPDGLLIVVAILSIIYFSLSDRRRFFLWCFLPYTTLMLAAMSTNYLQFGHLTPTTARLKIGDSPSITYSIRYALDNSFLSYTDLSLLGVLLVVIFVYRRFLFDKITAILSTGCAITCLFALYNSDVLVGARMYWASTCVMATLLAAKAPPVLLFNTTKDCISISKEYIDLSALLRGIWLNNLKTIAIILGGFLVVVSIGLSLVTHLRQAIATSSSFYSPTAQQYVIAKWISEHLSPNDGAIGFFFLGTSYYLPSFEIADFLGKADEDIAMSKVKWGPPGHNKWDIDKTLDKWRIQAIVPAGPASNPASEGVREKALKALDERRDFGFQPALVLNERVSREFAYCYVPEFRPNLASRWGFFVRRDIASRFQELSCS